MLTKISFILWLLLYTYDYFSFIYIYNENIVPENRLISLLVLAVSSFTIFSYARFLISIVGKKPPLTSGIAAKGSTQDSLKPERIPGIPGKADVSQFSGSPRYRLFEYGLSIMIPLLFFGTGALFIIPGKPEIENYLHIAFYLILCSYSLYGALHGKTISHEQGKNWGLIFIILTLIYTPLALVEYSLFHFSFTGIQYFPDGAFALPAYCITWGLWVIIKNSLLIDTSNTQKTESVPEDFVKKHNITDREKEIIAYLITGNNNVDIASRLFISLRTVDTHVYNIYKKCGVKNRIALLKEIDSHRSPL